MRSVLQCLTLIVIVGSLVGGTQLIAQDYVGPEKCFVCHSDYTAWRNTMHANGYSVVLDDTYSLQDLKGVVADFDKNGVDDFKDGLDFNTISSVFDPYKPNAPVLNYSEADGYTITIGDVTHKVYMTYGGSGFWKQRFMLKINTSEGESEALYISPVQYNETTDEYTDYHPEAWWDENNDPIYTPSSTLVNAAASSRSMPKKCAGCHMTGLSVQQDENGEWIASGAPVENEADYDSFNNVFDLDGDGSLEQVNTTCENSMCHGPGAAHASSPSADNINNPGKGTPEEQNNACGMCHNRGKSKPNNTFGFPFDDENLIEPTFGDNVETLFTDGGVDWGDDKTSLKHRQQFLGFSESSKPTFQFHMVTCNECHNVHNNRQHQIVSQIAEEDSLGEEIIIATEVDNNTLCLSCHATHGDFEEIPTEWVADYQTYENEIGAVVEEHTYHPYDPENSGASRCVDCHMPTAAKSAVAYDIHAHTFEAISPQKTEVYSMPNACAVSCHMQEGLNFGVDFTSDNLTDWSEASDLALADTLMHYYGPAGIWWDNDVTGMEEMIAAHVPSKLELSQNYPNPFNPSTTIEYQVPTASQVKIAVYNILGQQVALLVNKQQGAGNYSVVFDGSHLSSGMYVYNLQTDQQNITKKMMLMK